MKLTEYVTKDEVRRVCKKMKLRDWTRIKDPKISLKEAKIVLKQIDSAGLKIDPEQFRIGLGVVLEHGMRFKAANITNNHPVITGGKIVGSSVRNARLLPALGPLRGGGRPFQGGRCEEHRKGENLLPEGDRCPHGPGKNRGTRLVISERVIGPSQSLLFKTGEGLILSRGTSGNWLRVGELVTGKGRALSP